MSRKTLIALTAAAVMAGGTVAIAKGKGILFADWSKPTKGSYDLPAAEIGAKVTSAQPWTVTTVTSSIEGKPIKGRAVTLVGEVIDMSCYLQVGKHGDKHRDCGQKCARAGQPIGLLAKDGEIFTLIAEEHDPRRDGLTTLRESLIEQMAHVITVNGTLTEVEGQKAVYVQGFLKK